jgi:hypothetical protein
MIIGDLITDQWQVQWRETLLGWPATNLVVSNVTGWLDGPPRRTNNLDRPGQHGQFLSSQKTSARTIEVTFVDVDDDPAAFESLLNVIAPGESDLEEPLVIYLRDQPYLVSGRVDNQAVPTDQDWSVGYRRMTLRWTCTDPRKYGMVLHSANTDLPEPGVGGLVFPLVFPLNFGTDPVVGTLAAFNAGSVPTWPTLTFTGPVTGPIITNATTGAKLIFDPTFALGAGQSVVINTNLKQVLLGTGQNRRGSLFTANWFSFPNGATTVLSFDSISAYDPGAILTATWRDAWM